MLQKQQKSTGETGNIQVYLKEYKCPQCGNGFIPTNEWVYQYKYDPGSHKGWYKRKVLLCSYTCWNKPISMETHKNIMKYCEKIEQHK